MNTILSQSGSGYKKNPKALDPNEDPALLTDNFVEYLLLEAAKKSFS